MFDEQTVKAVTANCKVSAANVRAVFAALESVLEGAPVGTLCQDPETGAVALRVKEDGVLLWKVSAVNGAEWRDMQPTLEGWTVLSEPK